MISSVSHSSLVDLPGLVENGDGRKDDGGDVSTERREHGTVWRIAILISLSSFIFGYSMTALNVAITDDDDPGKLDKDISLSTFTKEVATSLTPVGAFLGCLVGASPADKYGRRPTLLFASVLFVAGTAIGSVFHSLTFLFVGRLIVGIGVGIESSVVPMYLLEISPKEIRGSVSTLHQFAITVGILVSSLVGAAFVSWVHHGWQYVLGLTALPAVLQLVCAKYIPESPRWLVLHSKRDMAREALRQLFPTYSVALVRRELADIEDEVRAASKMLVESSSVSWREMVTKYSRELVVGCTIMSLTALTGINTVIFYSTDIFKLAGVKSSIIGTIAVTLTNVLATFVTVKIVEKMGRKTLLTSGMWIMFVPLLGMCIVLLVDIDDTVQGVVAIVAVLIFIVGFAIGLGAVSWVVVSEIVPASIRAKANGLFVSMNWLINIGISLGTLSAIEKLGGGSSDDDKKKGVAILYGMFGAITAGGLFFVYAFVEETGASFVSGKAKHQRLMSTEDDGDAADIFGDAGDASRDREHHTVPSFSGDDLFDERRRGSSDAAPAF